MPVPDGVDAADAETVAGQRDHGLADAAPDRRVRAGGTIVVLGANGGVGSTLVQLASHAGITVIGTASTRHHADGARARRDPGRLPRPGHVRADPRDRAERRGRGVRPRRRRRHGRVVAAAAPRRNAGVLRHRGHQGRGGRLPAPGAEAVRPAGGRGTCLPNGRVGDVLQLLGRPAPYRRLPCPAAPRTSPRCWRLLADGVLTPQVAARFPLSEAGSALALAESRTVAGKVVIVPDA